MKQADNGSRMHLHRFGRLMLAMLMLAGAKTANANPPPPPLPSTFDTTIGNGLLCLDALDINYYYRYLTTALGKPYKHAEGAYWFKLNKFTLWKVPVSDLLVSDGKANTLFLVAIASVAPEKLELAIAAETGIAFRPAEAGTYPRLASDTGSNIVYFHNGAKVYCAKSRYLLPQSM
ncbi:MAG: hypothetical protein ACYC3O_04075 [Burkholderiales bacterium]